MEKTDKKIDGLAKRRARLYAEKEFNKIYSDQEFEKLFLLGKEVKAALKGSVFINPYMEGDEFEGFVIYRQYELSLEFANKKKTIEDWEHFEMD